MFDMEEKELNNLGQTIKDIPKPDNMSDYIRKGIAEGIVKKRRNKIKMLSNLAAVFVIAVFITSIRTIPAFAALVAKIPGLDYVVELINHDKGLEAAVENNFIEHVNKSETHEGLTFTIKDVILDNSKGIIFYTIEDKGEHNNVGLNRMEFLDEKGEHLKAGVTFSSMDEDMAKEKVLTGKVEIDFNEETVLPDIIKIAVKLQESDKDSSDIGNEEKVLGSVWNFELPVDKEKIKSMQKTYVLNQTVVVEGQKILFKQVVITPTRIGLDIEYDKTNTKKIFRFDDIKLINEKGEEWGTIENGVTGSQRDEYHETLYFQSNYFTEPKELYVTGSSLHAIDKDKRTVEIDMENSKLLKAPDDGLTLQRIEQSEEATMLNFNLRVDDTKDAKFVYNGIFGYTIKDSSGTIYERNTSGASLTVEGKQRLILEIKGAVNIKNHLYLTLEDYPKRINGDFKVKVK